MFGVHSEAITCQVNFHTDESGKVGKGANAIVSRLYYFFEVHGLREMDVFLHTDSCTAQNKNNTVHPRLSERRLSGSSIIRTSQTVDYVIEKHVYACATYLLS